jgi:hypothetical protein
MRTTQGRPKGVVRSDRLGRMKETRHGTRHFTTWRPAAPERETTARRKAGLPRRGPARGR